MSALNHSRVVLSKPAVQIAPVAKPTVLGSLQLLYPFPQSRFWVPLKLL